MSNMENQKGSFVSICNNQQNVSIFGCGGRYKRWVCMSISALSSNLVTDLSQQQWQNPFKEVRQDFEQLAGALQSGDLSGAQSAYSSIQQLLEANTGSSSSSPSSSSPNTLQSDFAALGQALSSGSLTQAQSAFSQLKTDFQAARQSRYEGANGPSQGQDQYVPSSSKGPNAVTQALEDYTQLSSDIQSGDLTDAQTAYASLQQLVGNPNPSTPTTPPTAIQSDFTTLGQAIQSGDATQAQSAFSQLQSDFQTATQPPASPAATTTATTPVQNPVQNPAQEVRQDYAELAGALQSGDLTTAQSAFTALQQALQTQTGSSTASTVSSTTASATSNDPIANDLSALGQALSSGNLTQAQSAFAQLKTDIRTAQQSAATGNQGFTPWLRAGGHGHHHHGGGGGYGSESSTSSSSTASNTNSGINVYA
jgi:hypothetical protein